VVTEATWGENAAVLIQGYAEDRGNPQLVPFGTQAQLCEWGY